MRLPSHVLAKLYFTGLAASAACEEAPHERKACEARPVVEPVTAEDDARPLDEIVRMTDERPAVAPRHAQPQPQPQPSRPQPQPVVKKPKPRQVWTSVCGHAPQLVDEGAAMVKCGRG